MANTAGSKSPKAQKRRANKFELESVLLQLKSIKEIITLDMDEDTAIEVATTLENCSQKLIKIGQWFRKRSAFTKDTTTEVRRTREIIDIRTMPDVVERWSPTTEFIESSVPENLSVITIPDNEELTLEEINEKVEELEKINSG